MKPRLFCTRFRRFGVDDRSELAWIATRLGRCNLSHEGDGVPKLPTASFAPLKSAGFRRKVDRPYRLRSHRQRRAVGHGRFSIARGCVHDRLRTKASLAQSSESSTWTRQKPIPAIRARRYLKTDVRIRGRGRSERRGALFERRMRRICLTA